MAVISAIIKLESAIKTAVLVLDLAGTFVFAVSGAIAAIRHRLDLFGVLVVSFAAATFGGMSRDLLIGAVPPAAINDWRYLTISVLAGLAGFFFTSTATRLHTPLLVFDAAGLALFAVSGSLKALQYGAPPLAAILLGALTGIGGGIARDILVGEIPTVLRADLYAVAALAGAAIVVLGNVFKLPFAVDAAVGGVLCFGLRFIAIWRGWSLPTAHWPGEPNAPSPSRRDDIVENPQRAKTDKSNETK
ncbi:MAG TPA: trimeric intracellular cation channel family protein [Chthoniobacterales bacterium]|jgi:uncharacterized membrane protein YeiH